MKKQTVGLLGGILSCIIIITFALVLMAKDIEQNAATWVMWLVLDILAVVTSVRAGNKRPWLPIGFTAGAFCVSCVLLWKGTWHWGQTETICSVLACMSAVGWVTLGANAGVIMCVFAMNFAGIPVMVSMAENPDPQSWWLWSGVAVGALLSTLGAKDWSLKERLLPTCSCMFNIIMTFIVLR